MDGRASPTDTVSNIWPTISEALGLVRAQTLTEASEALRDEAARVAVAAQPTFAAKYLQALFDGALLIEALASSVPQENKNG